MTNNEEIKKMTWQHKVAEYLLYLTVFMVPLFFSFKHMFYFNTPKIILMIGLTIISAIFYLWGNWNLKKTSIGFSFLSVALLLFLIILTISSVIGIDPINSFFGWRNTFPLTAMYAISIFSLIASSLAQKDKNILINMASASVVSSFFVMVIFYLDILNPKYSLTDGSSMGNSSYLGGYLLFNFLFALGLFLYFKKPWKKIVITVISLFIIISPVFINKDFLLGRIGFLDVFQSPIKLLGFANGAVLGVGLSVAVSVFLLMIFSRKKWIKIFGLFLSLALLFGIVIAGNQLATSGTKLNKIFTEEKSGNRFIAWDIAKQGFIENPLLGNGYNNYIYNSEKYHNLSMYQRGYSVERFIQPHNVVWEFASNAGLLGVFGYLGLLSVLFVTLLNFKQEENSSFKKIRIVLAGLLVGYFIQNLFVFDTINTYLTLFIVVSFGLVFSKKHRIEISDRFSFIKNTLIILLIILGFWMMYKGVVSPWNDSTKRARILNKDKILDINKSVSIREELKSRTKFSGVMDSTYQADNLFMLYQNALSKVNNENKKLFLNELESIVKDVQFDIDKQPNYAESYLVISKILNLYLMIDMKEGNIVRFNGTNYDKDVWERSYTYVTKSIEINPSNPQAYLILSQLYMLKADFKNAHLYNKMAIEMAPEYNETYSFARFLLKVNPHKDFESYVNKMEEKNILDNSL